VDLAGSLCARLVEGGVGHLHFYTLNRPHLSREVCRRLGVLPEGEAARVA
jgi:methylenetetrahydrofolate reductase (NADPH)